METPPRVELTTFPLNTETLSWVLCFYQLNDYGKFLYCTYINNVEGASIFLLMLKRSLTKFKSSLGGFIIEEPFSTSIGLEGETKYAWDISNMETTWESKVQDSYSPNFSNFLLKILGSHAYIDFAPIAFNLFSTEKSFVAQY